MLNLPETPTSFLKPINRVVTAALATADGLNADDVMVVGAWCRDILHHALGHSFATAATRDLDLALALSSWDAYNAIASSFPRVGDRHPLPDRRPECRPAPVRRHRGSDRGRRATRTWRTLSVWAFDEIFAGSLHLVLTPAVTVRIPSVSGFATAKLGAWLDRSEWLETKDAGDLALILHWYAESPDVQRRLYDTAIGNDILIATGADVALAAAQLLGADIATTIGSERSSELLARWPGDLDLLIREFNLYGGAPWPRASKRRRQLLDALTRGLTSTGW